MPNALDAGFGQDVYLYNAFMKEWYMSKWIDLLNNSTTSYKLFRRRTVSWKGRRMLIPLRTARSGAVEAVKLSAVGGAASGSASAGAQSVILPGYQGVDVAYVRPKILMAAIGLAQDTLDMAQGDRACFLDALDAEMMGIKADTASYMDLLLFRGGRPLAIIKNRDYDSSGGGSGNGFKDWQVDNIAGFHKNKRLIIYSTNTTGATRRTDHANGWTTVESTARTNRIVNVDFNSNGAAQPVANNDVAYTKGARDTNTSFEFLGLEEIVNTTNLRLNTYEGNAYYLGIDRTNNDIWQSSVTTLGGGLTFDAIQTQIDDIHDNSGGETTLILTTRTVRRQYAKKCQFTTTHVEASATQTNLRFTNTTRAQAGLVSYTEDMRGEAGNDWMQYDNRIPIMVDRFCNQDDSTTNGGFMYLLDTRHFFYALVTDWKWWAPEGSILREAPNGSFGLVAHAYILGEFVCDAPNTCGVIKGIALS